MRRGITSRTLLLLVLASALALAMLAPWPVGARDEYGEQHGGEYAQVNLVSNGYVSAEITDPNLVNPGGWRPVPRAPSGFPIRQPAPPLFTPSPTLKVGRARPL